jgi:DNA modification methylase
MLFKTQDKASGKVLKHSRPLLITPQQAYVRPAEGKDWFMTTTTIWQVDEIIKRRVRDWRRLTGETGHSGARDQSFRNDHFSIYTGTHSIFPAPLMEMILMRYCPPGGKVLDAFAGGPPRGLVSAIMGHEYVGFEIREDQIDENREILRALKLEGCTYIRGDGRYLDTDDIFDCAVTCPPYFDLEVYSQDPDDISTSANYQEFNASMWLCAQAHFDRMKPGAFVCIIVGLFRNKTNGELIDFPADTVENFKDAGFLYWQHIILSKNFASAAVRAGNAWNGGKKLVPRHENLLVFRKPGWAHVKRSRDEIKSKRYRSLLDKSNNEE